MKYKNLEECINAIDDKALSIDASYAASLSLINTFFRWKMLVHLFFLYFPMIVGIIFNFGGFRKQITIAFVTLLVIEFFEACFEDIIRKHYTAEYNESKLIMAEREFTKNDNYYNYSEKQRETIFTMQILPVIGLSSDIKENNERKNEH
jgi:hypothetical protein